MDKKLSENILKNDKKIIELSQKRALEILSSDEVSMSALTSALKESAKRISEQDERKKEENIFIEIVNFSHEQDSATL